MLVIIGFWLGGAGFAALSLESMGAAVGFFAAAALLKGWRHEHRNRGSRRAAELWGDYDHGESIDDG